MLTLTTVKTILTGDATLMATCTGGVWLHSDTGMRTGLSRTTTPAAFDAGGIIRPVIVLNMRNPTPDYTLADDADQSVSLRQMLECWMYEDSGYAAIDTMTNRVYALLHAKRLAGTFAVRWDGDFLRGQRDTDIDANVQRSDYMTRAIRRVAA